jgi:hypothetical protein
VEFRYIVEAGGDGIAKIVERFVDVCNDVPKRQIEFKINELAYKERRETDSKPTWYIKSEFEQWLKPVNDVPRSAKKSNASASASTTPNASTPGSSKTPKRKRDEKDGESDHEQQPTSTVKAPKKFKRAFGLFVKDFRDEAEKQLGDVAQVQTNDEMIR